MKYIWHLLFISCLGIWACSTPAMKSRNSAFAGEGKLYRFVPTTDKRFCNRDSVISTDCGLGNIYFTKNKHVVFTFFCMGDDSTKYEIGKYKVNSDGVTCTFDQTYSFYSGEPGQDIAINPNKGTLRKIKARPIKLKKLSCANFEYAFEGRSKDIYVLSESKKDQAVYYFKDYKQIKALSDL